MILKTGLTSLLCWKWIPLFCIRSMFIDLMERGFWWLSTFCLSIKGKEDNKIKRDHYTEIAKMKSRRKSYFNAEVERLLLWKQKEARKMRRKNERTRSFVSWNVNSTTSISFFRERYHPLNLNYLLLWYYCKSTNYVKGKKIL